MRAAHSVDAFFVIPKRSEESKTYVLGRSPNPFDNPFDKLGACPEFTEGANGLG